jgi:tRNA(Ile2) C34 agmatinyltransferase TiaS
MKTSQDAPVSGVYVSECCDVQLMFSKGSTLWRCPKCERLCNWDLLAATVIPNRVESEEPAATRARRS